MSRNFTACKQKVYNRGTPPDSFLDELLDWAVVALEEAEEQHARKNAAGLRTALRKLGQGAVDFALRTGQSLLARLIGDAMMP